MAGAALLLLTIGVVMVLSASTIDSIRANDGNPYAEFLGQAKFVLLGLPLAVVASRVPVAWYKRLAWPAFGAGLALQLLIFSPLALGKNGNVNWIYLPGLGQSVQPSEFLKLGLALWLGLVLARKGPLLGDWRHALVPVGGAGLAVLLVLAGHDMGTVLIILALSVGAFFVAGLPLRWFAAGGVLGVAAAAFLVIGSQSRSARVLSFLGAAEDDPTGVGFQTRHGLWGLGTGGVSGVGLGASREKWSYLPEAQNDFIFAIIGEELGLVGTLVVLALFAVLAVGMFRIVRRHRDPFVQITTAAIATWILAQALVNIGVVIGVLPVIGVPLPLVSAGGSAMISTLVAIGVLLAFARAEPGAAQALATRTGVVRRSLAVLGRRRG
ncbi:putative lipid II flippase FtsW [Georgenia sp. TF02-10]|uniref:FtsW/RodA/SpoVE family cell cycle protein n=1 Tax=Georgenia sp. TF02-10 TaxID=2917725 RepID=UPI001FA710D3|nr:putative peptidoglycan glycosyltransferase FtsW [Georgenia sp. TF02-10]UNX55978.1 putative lipid II flippase FtsW [Georgenia sp. TF02-10]